MHGRVGRSLFSEGDVRRVSGDACSGGQRAGCVPMARNRQNPRYEPTNKESVDAWFASSNSDAHAVLDWDVKAQQMAEAILGVLAAGSAVMFGRSMSGDAISVTIYTGDHKQRKWVADAIEFDDLMAAIWERGHRATARVIPIEGQLTGD